MRSAFIVPTYNEADNLPTLAARLLELEPAVDVVCVDDASPDGTGKLADEIAAANPRFHVIHRTGPRGYAVASKEGLGWCLDAGFDAVGSMDADLSHDPDAVPRLIRAIENGADMAIGSRYVDGGALEVEWGPLRRAVSRSGSRYARTMLRIPVRDCTSGFRCYRADVLRRIDLDAIRSDGYCFLIELLAAFVDLGAKIAEVPITYVDRRAGASKISRGIVLEAFRETTRLGFSRRLGRTPHSIQASARTPK